MVPTIHVLRVCVAVVATVHVVGGSARLALHFASNDIEADMGRVKTKTQR